jgi:hypothetical protein
MKKCEVCGSEHGPAFYLLGGGRPRETYRPASIILCEECWEAADRVMPKCKARFRAGERDTTNSRYSILKAAIKKHCWGNPNINIREIKPKYAR